jgi:hypothetical protein
MKPYKTLMTVALMAACAAYGCASRVDVDKVPVGTEVQVVRQDGALVEGTLSARDEKAVAVKAGKTIRSVPRAEIVDVKVVPPGRPAEVPPVAKFREYLVPEGSALKLTLGTSVSSETSQVGDRVEATLTEAVRVDDVIVLPEGSVVRGTVTDVESGGKVKGRASLAIHFDSIEARQERYPIGAGIAAEAASTKKKDAAMIGIGAGAGAIVGAVLGGGKGAATGAAIGGGGGTAVVLMTEGKPVVFGAGSSMTVHLTKPVDVRVPLSRTTLASR